MNDREVIPHGGRLVNLLLDPEHALAIKNASGDWPSWDLTARQLCDIELLMNGAFSPLQGFMCRADYESVCADARLADGTLWPVPVTLDVTSALADVVEAGARVLLRDPEGVIIAALTVEDKWTPDRDAEVRSVFGTTSRNHPGVAHQLEHAGSVYLGGRIEALQQVTHYDYRALRHTPSELRAAFTRLGWRNVVAFQTHETMHRGHQELTLQAAREHGAGLLIHPVAAMMKPGDMEHYTRMRCYKAVLSRYPPNTALLSLLPLATRMAGPKDALLDAIIHKNYGCTHLIIGPGHADPGAHGNGNPFYDASDAQELLRQHREEIGVTMVPFKTMVYLPEKDAYVSADDAEKNGPNTLSERELRKRLAAGEEIPAWFTLPEVARELRKTHPPRHRQGLTLFFTGLSGAGKSTIANIVLVKLMELGRGPVTLLDGDIVRKRLSSELGFSKEHRELNVLRIGYVASEITKNGGVAICAPIAPYDSVRRQVRDTISSLGGFVLVHVATPLHTCEARDRKGLYAKARAGLVQEFTGISDPYEEPTDAEIEIDTTHLTAEQAAQQVIDYLQAEGYVAPDADAAD